MQHEPPALLYALAYAEHGYHIFPCAQDKRPRVKWKTEATTDPERIRTWWRQWPDSMIGLPTGNGLAVLDLDVDRETGEAIGEATIAGLGWADLLSEGIVARTPSGGKHVYFFGTLATKAGQIGPGVDTRGSGGYVIAPGSVNGRGTYEWEGAGLLDREPGLLPPEIADAASRAADRIRRDPLDIDCGPPPGFDQAGPTVAEIEDALSCIGPDLPYSEWVSVLMALHDHLGAGGFELADRWSARGNKYEPGCVAERWRSFKPGGGVGIGTLFEMV